MVKYHMPLTKIWLAQQKMFVGWTATKRFVVLTKQFSQWKKKKIVGNRTPNPERSSPAPESLNQ